MYDKTKVIIGLLLFLGVATLPFWIGAVDPQPMPPPVIEAGLEQCVEPPEYMRANHMVLLDEWRNSVVRDGDRVYVSSSGRKFEKSLSKTCLECHSNQAEFCERCHDSVNVKPYCWGCHLVPLGEAAQGAAADPARQARAGRTPEPSAATTLRTSSENRALARALPGSELVPGALAGRSERRAGLGAREFLRLPVMPGDSGK